MKPAKKFDFTWVFLGERNTCCIAEQRKINAESKTKQDRMQWCEI